FLRDLHFPYTTLFRSCTLYSGLYLMLLAIWEMLISSPRIRLLVHAIFTLIFIVLSGALIPAIYFPLYIQDWLAYVPAYEALFWLDRKSTRLNSSHVSI